MDLNQRYSRHIAYGKIGTQGQSSIINSRVLVVGVGGLGSWISELLIRAGVGKLVLVDADRVELSNIHRQAMYNELSAKNNEPKVSAAREYLVSINSLADIQTHQVRLDGKNIADFSEGVDLIIDGTDNFETRFLINRFAVKNRIPWIFAGVAGLQGQVMVVRPHKTACLECIYDSPPSPETQQQVISGGVIGPAVAVIASYAAVEAVKLLSRKFNDAPGKLLKFNMSDDTVQSMDTSVPVRGCPCCGK